MQIQTSTPSAKADGTQQTTAKMSSYELAKKTKDAGILQAHIKQSSEAADNPQKLLLKAAITEINDALAPYLGENAAQKAYESDIDFSPQATAERIVDGSTAFFNAFKENNPDLSEEDAIIRFNDIINDGITQGFNEAKGLLESLKVLEGKVSEDIDTTYDFVQQGLNSFKEKLLADLSKDTEQNTASPNE